MVIGKFKNKTYFKNLNGESACIEQLSDGSALLFVNSSKGEEIFRRYYANRHSALTAWNRISVAKKKE